MESRFKALANRYGYFVDPWAPAQGAAALMAAVLSTAARQGGGEYSPAAGINPLAWAVLEHFGHAAEKAAWAAIKEVEGWSLHRQMEEEARFDAHLTFIEENRRLKRRFSGDIDETTKTALRRAQRAQTLARREARRLKALQQGQGEETWI